MAKQTPIPQNPIGESFVWREWFQRLSDRVFGTAAALNVPIQPEYGGTGLTTYNAGDIIYSNATDNLTRLAGPASQSYLTSSGGAPSWVTSIPWSKISSMPRIEAYDLSASIALDSTPALLKPASTTSGTSGITYDSSTGEFTFEYAGTYSLAIGVNATASASNQFVYIYAQNNTGSGWVDNVNSGKAYELLNANTVQIVYAQAVARVAGQKVRYYIYSNSNKVDLTTFSMPSTSTVYVPAIRIQYAG